MQKSGDDKVNVEYRYKKWLSYIAGRGTTKTCLIEVKLTFSPSLLVATHKRRGLSQRSPFRKVRHTIQVNKMPDS